FMLAGGVEDFSEASTTEFANMGATCSTVEEVAHGREPSEMCRPCTSSRSGFVEGQGASIVVLMSASAAIKMGAPVYGVVAMSGTATDKQGRSVPAPGKGILTSARGVNSSLMFERRMSLGYRRKQLQRHVEALERLYKEEKADLEAEAAETNMDASQHLSEIKSKYKQQLSGLCDIWGNEFWKQDKNISPLQGCLAVWGLSADDIGLASFHGTSTVANDKNESDVLNAKLEHIGRTPGYALPVVCQKWLTGHSKAAAAGTMLNGILQSMSTGLIPGNRNADNIDPDFQQYNYALYLSKTIQTPGIKAALMTSFGFGQVSGELLIVHPDYLFASVDPKEIDEYNRKLAKREKKAYRYWQDTLVGNHPFVQVKENPPYTADQEKQVYLDPFARAKYDAKTKQYKF
ncbi:fatty acid synthase alpha subunit Lsd1, partial [Coemansia sp. RSA 486]